MDQQSRASDEGNNVSKDGVEFSFPQSLLLAYAQGHGGSQGRKLGNGVTIRFLTAKLSKACSMTGLSGRVCNAFLVEVQLVGTVSLKHPLAEAIIYGFI